MLLATDVSRRLNFPGDHATVPTEWPLAGNRVFQVLKTTPSPTLHRDSSPPFRGTEYIELEINQLSVCQLKRLPLVENNKENPDKFESISFPSRIVYMFNIIYQTIAFSQFCSYDDSSRESSGWMTRGRFQLAGGHSFVDIRLSFDEILCRVILGDIKRWFFQQRQSFLTYVNETQRAKNSG